MEEISRKEAKVLGAVAVVMTMGLAGLLVAAMLKIFAAESRG